MWIFFCLFVWFFLFCLVLFLFLFLLLFLYFSMGQNEKQKYWNGLISFVACGFSSGLISPWSSHNSNVKVFRVLCSIALEWNKKKKDKRYIN